MLRVRASGAGGKSRAPPRRGAQGRCFDALLECIRPEGELAGRRIAQSADIGIAVASAHQRA